MCSIFATKKPKKRGDFTARTVITSDPTIGNNQLGVPVKIAMNLTFPEVVTPYNIDYLGGLVKNGRDVYPGANFVFPVSRMSPGKRLLPIDLRYRKEGTELRYGDVVERHLKDGDIVLLNRQPTLHKQSMMGHRIKVIDNLELMTYRLSVAITTPYNADFDGDEMNIFVPQSLQTQIELEEIACVEKQIITPTTSKTIVGIVQDGLLGAYNLTSPTVRIDWRNAMNIMSYTSLEDFSTIKKNKDFTGAELYSLIIPPGINVNRPTLKIKNGQLTEGRLSKEVLGSKKKNNLIQLIWDGYGVNETKNFIDNTQRLINNFNLWYGFSVGIGDVGIPQEVNDEIDQMFVTKDLKIEHIITEMENNPDFMQQDLFEQKLFSEMNIVRDNVSKLVMANLSSTNGFNIMASAGSKGDATNMGQMTGCLGLQAFEGKIIPKKYNNRTLVYFHQNDDRSASRGLVRQSFIEGMQFPEFVFHLMASRMGLIEQAIKTSETGYTQRKLIKSMEDIMIKYDGTVRSANDGLIQLIYGDSGADTTRQYEYTIKMIEMNNEELKNKFGLTAQELKNTKDFTEKDNAKMIKDIMKMRDIVRDSVRKARMNYIVLVTNFMLPVNLNRIVDTIAGREDLKSEDELTPKYIIQQLEQLVKNENTTILCMSQEEKNDPNSFKIRDENSHKIVFRTALYDSLSPKRMIFDLGLSKKQFDTIINEVSFNFNRNIVEPGEMAGIIAAQSTGEPLTQMTLNSIDWNDEITIRSKISNTTNTIKIGKFIDDLIENNIDKVEYLGNNKKEERKDIYYLDTKENDYYIDSVDEDSVVSIKKIEAVTKHLPMNSDGTDTLLRITTKSGKNVTATKAKSLLTWDENGKVVPIRGDEIKIGTLLPIVNEHNNAEVIKDEIVLIEDVNPSHEYVYDLTVEDTKNFILANGLAMRDSFHHSGIASMSATVQGVPRMKELLSVSKKPKTPQMVIYLTKEYMNSKDMAHKLASHIKHTTLGDIRGRINVYYDPNPKAKGSIMEKDNVQHVFFHHKGSRTNCQGDTTGLPWLLRIELDREKMLEKEVTLLEIKSKFCGWWEKRFADLKSMKKEEKKVINKITQLAVLSNSDNDESPILHIRFNVKDTDKEKDKFDLNTIDNFIDFIIDKFKLKGINSVTDIPAIQEERILSFNEENGNIDKDTQHVIYTAGVNLEEIRYLVGIDLQRTISNHVMDVYETFGIEMARAVLLREIANAYERAGGEVNYQHVTMIVDQMTATGAINSVDRHGMNKSDSDPLSRASFEKTVEQLLIASVYGETDHMRGVSSRIMAGAVIRGGTGYCELELDTDMIEKSEYIEGIDYTKKFTELNKGTLAEDIIKKKNDDIFIPM